MKPMTIEEAVKEAEFRDRDLLIFRNAAGDTYRASSPPRRADGTGGDSVGLLNDLCMPLPILRVFFARRMGSKLVRLV